MSARRPRRGSARLLAVGLLAVTAGCSDADGSATGSSGGASCVDHVTVDGATWTAVPLSDDLSRELVGPPVAAVRDYCQDFVVTIDGETQSLPTDAPEDVALRRIHGVPATQALFDPDHYPDVVYVPGRRVTATAELPAAVRELVRHG